MPALAYTITPDDYVAFCLHQATRPDRRRRQRIMVTAIGLAVAFGPVLVPWALGSAPFKTVLAQLPMTLVLAVLLQAILHPVAGPLHRFSVRRGARQILGRRPSGTFLGPWQLWTTEDGLQARGSESSTQIAWSAVQGLSETAEHLFVSLGPAQSLIVPKRGLEREALDAFKAAVRERAPAARG